MTTKLMSTLVVESQGSFLTIKIRVFFFFSLSTNKWKSESLIDFHLLLESEKKEDSLRSPDLNYLLEALKKKRIVSNK